MYREKRVCVCIYIYIYAGTHVCIYVGRYQKYALAVAVVRLARTEHVLDSRCRCLSML